MSQLVKFSNNEVQHIITFCKMVRCVSSKFFKSAQFKLQQNNVRMSVPPQQSFFKMVKKSSICCRNSCTVIWKTRLLVRLS